MAHVEQPKSERTEIAVSQAELATIVDGLEALVDQYATALDLCTEDEQPEMRAAQDAALALYSLLVPLQRC